VHVTALRAAQNALAGRSLPTSALEASHLLFFNICLKKVLKIFWKTFLGVLTFSLSLNASPRSAIIFTTEAKRCRQRRFPIFVALIDLTD